MFKQKLALFLAAATLSLSASAGYVQYDFSGSFQGGGGVSGFFIQDEDTKVVAYYNFSTSGCCLASTSYHPSGMFDNIASAHTYFPGAGPTSFRVIADHDSYVMDIELNFIPTYTVGVYGMSGMEAQMVRFGDISDGQRRIVGGRATASVPADELLRFLAAGPVDGITWIVPTLLPSPVPEPAPLALLLAGMAAMFGLRRRKAS